MDFLSNSVLHFITQYETLLLSMKLYYSRTQGLQAACRVYSTVTDLAKLRGLSTSVPRAKAAW